VGIPPSPRGVPQVEVSFEIDANGIVNVSAKDKMTGVEQAMQITPSSGLAPDEIEQLIMEAETSIDKDKRAKEMILQKNRLESLIANARRALSEFGKSFPLEEQQEFNAVLSEAEELLTSEDQDELQSALMKVESTANRITESMLTMV
jgi:molecular chaperone DnaK